MSRALLIFFLSALIGLPDFSTFANAADHQSFIVYVGSRKVGKIIVSRQNDGRKIVYNLHSEVKVDLLVDFNIEESIADVFEDGRLLSSCHIRKINHAQKVKNMARYDGGKYVLSNVNDKEREVNEWITWTIVTLYHHEPQDGIRIYSQSFQQMVTLKKTRSHGYVLNFPNGSSTNFMYSGGKLQQVTSDTMWGVIKFIREV